MLYVGGKRMRLARWPNPEEHFPKMLWKEDNWRKGVVSRSGIVDKGPVRKDPDYATRGGTFRYSFDRPALWTNAKEIWLDGIFTWSWEWSYNKVAAIDPASQTITLQFGENSGIQDKYSGNFFFAENLIEEMDQPGEYYIDRETGILYFYPTEEFNNGAEVVLSTLGVTMISLNDVSNMVISNLCFDTGRSDAMNVRMAENVKIQRCEFSNFAGTGISLNGKDCMVEQSSFHDLGGICMYLTGGDFKTLTPSGNVVSNCKFTDFGWFKRVYTAAALIDGVGTTFSNNLIQHCPHAGLLLVGNDHLIERNEFHHVNEEFIDLGAIYVNVGWSPLQRGWMIRNNYFHDVGSIPESPINSVGIYFDHGSQGGTVEGNVFYNMGLAKRGWATSAVMATTALYQVVKNNIFIDCTIPMKTAKIKSLPEYIQRRNEVYHWQKYFNGFDLSGMPHLQKYPEVAPFLPGAAPPQPEQFWKRFEKNVIWNPTVKLEIPSGIKYEKEKEEDPANPSHDPLIAADNWVTDDDPGFVDAAQQDFTLKPDAEVFSKIPDFQPIPFKSIGLQKEVGVQINSTEPSVINITGATAFRSAACASINAAFAAGGNYSVVFTNTDDTGAAVNNNAGSYQAWRGTFPGISGQTIIRTSWNGSVEGVRALVTPNPTNNASYWNTGVIPAVGNATVTTTTLPFTAFSGNSTQAAADLAFSDVTQASTPIAGSVSGGPVGVVVFTIVANKTWRNDVNAATITAPTSISAQQFKQLFASGKMPLSYFTSNTLNTNLVYATGRNDGSGTRTQYLVETGYGISNPVNQYVGYDRTNTLGILPSIVKTAKGGGFNAQGNATTTTASTVWGQDIDGNGGYNTGQDIRSDMAKTTASTTVYEFSDADESGDYDATEAVAVASNVKLYLLSWLSVSDAKSARGNNATSSANAQILGYNGVRLDDLENSSGGLASTGLSTNDRAKVVNGAYTAWGYEQLFHNNTANQVIVFNDLKSRLNSSSVIGSAGIPLGEMNVNRAAGDGEKVVSGPLP